MEQPGSQPNGRDPLALYGLTQIRERLNTRGGHNQSRAIQQRAPNLESGGIESYRSELKKNFITSKPRVVGFLYQSNHVSVCDAYAFRRPGS